MRRNTPSMMIDFNEKELQTKQGGAKAFIKTTTEAKRLRSLNARNPRIVRAPRSFGRKDRHSKVSTVRGLRDRRVRLSVPTAIQVYNLQDTLGLNQPSKVIDWLLNATKHAIDELPPLQFPPESLINLYGVSALNSPQVGGAHQASTSSTASVRLEELAQKHCIDENIVFGGGMQDSFMASENISSMFASNASFAMDFDGKQEYNHALQLKSSLRASHFGVPNNMSFLHPNLAFTIREANHNPN